MKAWLFDCGTREPGASWGLLLLRVAAGGMMALGHGWPKVVKFADFKDDWPVPGFLPFLTPPLSLIGTIVCELLCGILLVLGLLSRPAAFLLGFAMTVAAFDVLGNAPWFLAPGVTAAKEPALLYLLVALVVIVSGPGAWSLDAGIYQDRRRRRW
jgi:putative oxidoreductase